MLKDHHKTEYYFQKKLSKPVCFTDCGKLKELQQVLPSLKRSQIKVLLRELRDEQQIHCIGNTSAARWFEGPTPDETNQS